MERNGRNWRAPVALITQTNKGRRWWTFGVERGGGGTSVADWRRRDTAASLRSMSSRLDRAAANKRFLKQIHAKHL